MHSDRWSKDDNQDKVYRTSSGGMADAHDLASKRSAGTVPSEMLGASSVSIFQSVPQEVLELICKRLSPFDLCSLCQVNGHHQKLCSTEEFWRSRIEGMKLYEDLSSKQNVLSAERRKVSVEPVIEPVRLKGDFMIVDPFRFLFVGRESARRELQRELHDLQQRNHWVFVVKYRNEAAYFISSDSYDPEPAFEISRNGTTLGVHEHPSRFIAVFTKKMVDLLLKENGEGGELEGGVSIESVDGELICSGDGDFVISGSPDASPGRKVSRWIEDDCVRNADILCAAGGRWTFCDDSSDEEDEGDGEITDEEMEMFLDQDDSEECLKKEDIDCGWNSHGSRYHFRQFSTGYAPEMA